MAAFGTLTLLIALVVATYAGVASLVGARRGNRRLIDSGRAGVYALAAVLGLSSVALRLRLRDPRLLDQVRPPLLGRVVAALLPDHRVLGRPRRVDPLVGLPAVGVLGHRRSTPTATATASSCPTS